MQDEFTSPVFIISAPRSGSSLLYETLRRHPDIVSTNSESHNLIEGIPELQIPNNNFDSNALTEKQLTPEIRTQLHQRFVGSLVDAQNNQLGELASHQRFIEKTPKNVLRIPFLNAMYPDAKFVYLVREPIANISSIIEAWRSNRFVTYPHLPGWSGYWSLLLPPGWREYVNKPLARVAAFQWAQSHLSAINALADIEPDRISVVSYQAFIDAPSQTCDELFKFMGLSECGILNDDKPLPLSRYTVSTPHPDKWFSNAAQILSAMPEIEPVLPAINRFLQERSELSLSVDERVFKVAESQALPVAKQDKRKISRNDPCHCGSGKRYKRCHGLLK